MYSIPLEFFSIAKPSIEIRGLDGSNEEIRQKLIKELFLFNLLEVDNFNLLPKQEKQGQKGHQVSLEWMRKYTECLAPVWIEVFNLSPLENNDSQIIEDLIIGVKFATANNKKYIPIVICPDQNAFGNRLINIKNISKMTVYIIESPKDSISRY